MPASQHQTERRSLGPCKGTWALWTLVTSALCFEEDHTPARQQEACGCVTYEKYLLRLSHYPRLTAANLVMPKNNGPPLRFQVGRCRVVDNWPSQLLYHGWHCVHSKHKMYDNTQNNTIGEKQTRVSPLSLFYLLLQTQRRVNRLQSIRQEPDVHNRVGVKSTLQQPRAKQTVNTRETTFARGSCRFTC